MLNMYPLIKTLVNREIEYRFALDHRWEQYEGDLGGIITDSILVGRALDVLFHLRPIKPFNQKVS